MFNLRSRPRRRATATLAVAAQSAAVDAVDADRDQLPPGTMPCCSLEPMLPNDIDFLD